MIKLESTKVMPIIRERMFAQKPTMVFWNIGNPVLVIGSLTLKPDLNVSMTFHPTLKNNVIMALFALDVEFNCPGRVKCGVARKIVTFLGLVLTLIKTPCANVAHNWDFSDDY